MLVKGTVTTYVKCLRFDAVSGSRIEQGTPYERPDHSIIATGYVGDIGICLPEYSTGLEFGDLNKCFVKKYVVLSYS